MKCCECGEEDGTNETDYLCNPCKKKCDEFRHAIDFLTAFKNAARNDGRRGAVKSIITVIQKRCAFSEKMKDTAGVQLYTKLLDDLKIEGFTNGTL